MTLDRTSDTHPIRVDWLQTPWRGEVGLTFAPGKKDKSALSGSWNRDLATDLERLQAEFRTDRLVCLIEDHELNYLGIPNLAEAAITAGISLHRLPIRDGDLPDDPGAFSRLVSEIVAWATAGERVVIHCRGGLGRAGTMGGCVLVAAGLSPDEAFEALSSARGPGCPENTRQRQYISEFRPSADDAE